MEGSWRIVYYFPGGQAVLTERIAEIEAEAHDLREQNELLEFRILELEECQENVSHIFS
jgi:hypothetical protein